MPFSERARGASRTFLAAKDFFAPANWGRTAVAEAMACMVFERRGSVELFVCCYGRSARARGVFTHHRGAPSLALPKLVSHSSTRIPLVSRTFRVTFS